MDSARDSHPAVIGLLRRFRAQRPIRAGSLLMTMYGDALAPRGGTVTLASLIALAAPFGLSERLVRTAVARLAAEGWLTGSRHGRRSQYRLTDSGQEVFQEATRRIYGTNPTDWDGHWRLLVLPPGRRSRRDLRQSLRWLGFGQISPGVFAHPACPLAQARDWLASQPGMAHAWLFTSRTEGLAVDRRLVAAGWDLRDLARRYRRFRDSFAPVAAAADLASLPPASAFQVRTLLIHEYRKIHLQDPLLPPSLLPREWIGTEAYALCRWLYAGVFAAAEDHLTQTAATVHEPLPPAAPAAYRRFGGFARR